MITLRLKLFVLNMVYFGKTLVNINKVVDALNVIQAI